MLCWDASYAQTVLSRRCAIHEVVHRLVQVSVGPDATLPSAGLQRRRRARVIAARRHTCIPDLAPCG